MTRQRNGEKMSIYIDSDVAAELRAEAARLDRPIGWLLNQAWKIAKTKFATLPTVNEPSRPE